MSRMLLSSAVLDVIERASLLVVYVFFMTGMIKNISHNGSFINFIYLFDQSLIVILLIFRRSAILITKNKFDWFLGVAGTFLPLLIVPVEKTSTTLTTVVAIMMLTGIMIHLSSKLILRRSFGVVAANRGIKVEGPYRMIRHPMYLGYMILQLGFLVAEWNIKNFVIIVTCWILFLLRIAAEEKVLSNDQNYRAFMYRVKFKLIPGIY